MRTVLVGQEVVEAETVWHLLPDWLGSTDLILGDIYLRYEKRTPCDNTEIICVGMH